MADMSITERCQCCAQPLTAEGLTHAQAVVMKLRAEATAETIRHLSQQLQGAVSERDRYWQALVDIAGHENWEPRTMGDIARAALDPPPSGGQ